MEWVRTGNGPVMGNGDDGGEGGTANTKKSRRRRWKIGGAERSGTVRARRERGEEEKGK